MVKREIKGFELSTSYDLLWALIHKGYRVPAWILYCNDYEEPIYDIVEVKMDFEMLRYSIGSRGMGYESFKQSLPVFFDICTKLEMRYIIPNLNNLT